MFYDDILNLLNLILSRRFLIYLKKNQNQLETYYEFQELLMK